MKHTSHLSQICTNSTANLSSHYKEKAKNSMEQRNITRRLHSNLDLIMLTQTSTIIQTNQTIKRQRDLTLKGKRISWIPIGLNSLDKNMSLIREKEFINSLQMYLGWMLTLRQDQTIRIEMSILSKLDRTNSQVRYFQRLITRNLLLKQKQRKTEKTSLEDLITHIVTYMIKYRIIKDNQRKTQ